MEKCSPKGRDCFEKHSSQTFNCSATCEGVYADVLWDADTILKKDMDDELVEEQVEMVFDGGVEEDVRKEMERLDKKLAKQMYKMYADLERKMKMIEGNQDKMGKEMDKEKFKKLISEYKKFKMENVRHFRFRPDAEMFGESLLIFFCLLRNT